MSSEPINLNTPVLEGGLRRIPFFNGRILTAEDLKTEQFGNAAERHRLGRALGTGVLEGLFVRPGNRPKTVTVMPGLALAPSGRVVELPQRTEVSVISEIDREETAGTKGRFANCSTQYATVTSGTGAYLLFVEPTEGSRGRVPRVRLGDNGAADQCGAQYRVEGARLCLAPVDLSGLALGEAILQRARTVSEARDRDESAVADLSMLRSLLAHACLGTATTSGSAASIADAFRGRTGEPVRYGPVDALRGRDRVSDDAVPVGLLYWLRDRIEFVDVWSVRRRVHRRDVQLPNPATDRRRAEAEAAVFQFHDHLDGLQVHDPVNQFSAGDLFAYLPPVGVVGPRMSLSDLLPPTLRPVFPELSTAAPSEPSEAELPEAPPFFDGLTTRGPSIVEPQRLRALIGEALQYPPLSLEWSLPPDPGKESDPGPLVWLYLLASNAPQESPESLFVFTTGYAPFLGDAQFNLSRVNRATYSSSSGPPGGS